ncbi:MAG: hypothetical protein KDA92_01330 [Planctomycetales bacterium]|nr:hypothetical protein [Planctomycetales bacterium]MCA9166109.1 hypothetical protein [Planctomycetales bacterium]
MSHRAWQLFEAFGIELEYMIVDGERLSVFPITDRVLHEVAGSFESEIELGEISWSNELALHVIELKTTDPADKLAGLEQLFQDHVGRINQLLAAHHARLMPTAMHPWMDPDAEMRLWPHEYNAVYEAFNRIFDCRGHGWANLQSVHINLPFDTDEQFGQLHAAIRLILPLLPALAASSPVLGGRVTGLCDNRLDVYRHNAASVPMISGAVVPEAVFTQADYDRKIFQPMFRDIAPLDPDGTLQHEWLNARGAIARFSRQSIEIRVLDIQECPRADLAICRAIVAVLRGLVAQRWTSTAQQQKMPTERLADLFLRAVRDADQAMFDDRDYLSHFGLADREACSAREIWQQLRGQFDELNSLGGGHPQIASDWSPIDLILDQGPLARRIVADLGGDLSPTSLHRTYERLCDCLRDGRAFEASHA